MPVKSEAQRKAMYAALEGHSNLGISKSVAKKFVGSAHDAGVTNHAAGILFVAPDGDVLMLRRGSQEENYAGYWALPGGKAEEGESPEQAADREATEEMGRKPDGNKKLLDQKLTPNGMAFHTFAQPVSHKFTPKLNAEHSGFAWAPLNMLPQPLHPAVADTLGKRLGQTKTATDMTPEDWDGLVNGMMKWLSEEEAESEHDEDNFEDAEDCLGEDATPIQYAKAEIKAGRFPQIMIESIAGAFYLYDKNNQMLAGSNSYKSRGEAESDRSRILDRANKTIGQDAKLSHTEVAYGSGKPTSKCSICQYFEKGTEPHCQLVEDPIEPEGWCKLFTADQDKILGGQDKKLAVDEKVLQLAMDRCIIASGGGEKYALDFAKNGSVREYDADGHLHVKRTPISKSNVCPYIGEEIPDAEELNLDPQKVYQLLRHPDELAKAAATSNGKPVMRKHVPVSSQDHKPYDVIGATGNEAVYEDPYLYNSLVIWPQDDIDKIESEEKVELSSGYRYKAVMTPGTFKGVHYDGIMTQLVFNHISAVEAGRAGSDVRVADSVNPNIGWAAIEEALLGLKENAS